MKAIAIIAFASAMLAAPSFAQTISDVDHADVPNCTVFGPNAANCENLTIQAVHPNNGLGNKHCATDPVTHETTCHWSW